MKLKISKSINTGKWERCIEYFAQLFVLASVIVLAMWTIFTSPLGITWFAKAFLSIFISAAAIVFYFEARHLLRKQPSKQQESTQIPTDIERAGRNKLISIGLLVLVAIILVPIFARQLLPDSLEYQAFLTAFAGVGAWVIGIALVVFTYQQYKLRQTEHRLLFEPRLILSSGGPPITGQLSYNDLIYPYRIEWSVIILNTSQQPILIEYMALKIRLWVENPNTPSNDEFLSVSSYHVLEPDRLDPPFQVSQSNPQRIRWILEGHDVSYDLEHISGETNNRRFELIFKIRATVPQYPNKSPLIMDLVSNPFHVPKDAAWGIPSPILY